MRRSRHPVKDAGHTAAHDELDARVGQGRERSGEQVLGHGSSLTPRSGARVPARFPGWLASLPTHGDHLFDHLSLGVQDLERAVTLYDAALAPLGYVRLWRTARAAGYGPPGFTGEAPFAIIEHGQDSRPPGPGLHVAFAAPDREAVDRFHAAALAAGGVGEGPPGIRENYDPGYYAAFVRDPDGHRLEAVVHERPVR